jgi:hypothetical protein
MKESQTKILEGFIGAQDLQLYTLQMVGGKNEITVPSIYVQCNGKWIEFEPEVESFEGTYIEWTVMEVREIVPPQFGKYVAVNREHESKTYPLIAIDFPRRNVVQSVEIYKFMVSNPGNPNEVIEYEGCIMFNCDGNLSFAISSYEAVTGTLTFSSDRREISRLTRIATQKNVIT